MNKLIVIISAVACVSVGINIWQYNKTAYLDQKQDFIVASDQPYIARAVEAWARFTRQGRDTAMEDRHPVVVEFANELCVKLALDRGSAGGSPVYCFDKRTLALTRRHENVE